MPPYPRFSSMILLLVLPVMITLLLFSHAHADARGSAMYDQTSIETPYATGYVHVVIVSDVGTVSVSNAEMCGPAMDPGIDVDEEPAIQWCGLPTHLLAAVQRSDYADHRRLPALASTQAWARRAHPRYALARRGAGLSIRNVRAHC